MILFLIKVLCKVVGFVLKTWECHVRTGIPRGWILDNLRILIFQRNHPLKAKSLKDLIHQWSNSASFEHLFSLLRSLDLTKSGKYMGATAFELLISAVPIENKIEIRDEREKDTDNFPKEPRGFPHPI